MLLLLASVITAAQEGDKIQDAYEAGGNNTDGLASF
jgi:hypothetical protein